MQDNRRSYSPPASATPPALEPFGAPDPHAQQPSHYPSQPYGPPQQYGQQDDQAQAQPSYAPPASMPPQGPGDDAVVLRRGRPREGRDLFATQAEDLGHVVQSDEAKPGIRGENSVLFTLDSLRNSASPPKQSVPAPMGNSGYPTHNSGRPGYGQTSYSAPPGVHDPLTQGHAGPSTAPYGQSSGYPGQSPHSSRAPSNEESTGTIDLLQMARDGGTSLKVKPVALHSSTFAEYMPKPVAAAPQAGAASGSLGLVLGLGGLAAVLVLGVLGGGLWYVKASAIPASPGMAISANAEIVVAEISHIAKLPKADSASAPGSKTPLHGGVRPFTGPSTSTKGTTTSPVAKPRPAADPCHCGGVLACVMRCSATGK